MEFTLQAPIFLFHSGDETCIAKRYRGVRGEGSQQTHVLLSKVLLITRVQDLDRSDDPVTVTEGYREEGLWCHDAQPIHGHLNPRVMLCIIDENRLPLLHNPAGDAFPCLQADLLQSAPSGCLRHPIHEIIRFGIDQQEAACISPHKTAYRGQDEPEQFADLKGRREELADLQQRV